MSLINVRLRSVSLISLLAFIAILSGIKPGSIAKAQNASRVSSDISAKKNYGRAGDISASTGSRVNVGSALYFPAIATGAVGPDLFVLQDLGVPVEDPVRTDPSASFGSQAGEGGGFRELNNNLYFFADTATEFGGLFHLGTNGVIAQTTGVNSTQEDAHFTYFDNKLYFRGLTAVGDELVQLDGTGVITPIDVNPDGNGNSFAGQEGGFGVFDGALYFSASTPTTGSDLFRLNAGSTTPIPVEINPGPAQSFAGTDDGFFTFSNRLYFNAFVAADGQFELLKLDVGSNTPTAVRDGANNIIAHQFQVTSTFRQFAGALYIDAVDPTTGGDTLVKINSAGVATPVHYLGSNLNNAGTLGGFIQFGGELYFTASTPATATDLFKIDTAGTVTCLNRTNLGSFEAFDANLTGGFTVFNGAMYFDAYNSGGDAFYKLDSLGAFTTVLDNGTTQAGVAGGYTTFGTNLYFSAYDLLDGYELFRLDPAGVLTHYNIKTDGTNNSEAGRPGGFVVFPGLAPTAAKVSISGRVLSADGRPVSKVGLTITGDNGATLTAITNPFGQYRFDGITPGQSYVISASSKRYQFPARVINITDEVTGLDLIAD